MTYLTFALVIVGGVQTVVFGVQARRLAETIETMRAISHDQGQDVARSIAEAGRAASAMESVAIAMNEQRKLMFGQQQIMASQRDLSFFTQRAWVRADLKIAGPVQVSQGGVTFSFELEITNSGALPAYATRPDINVYPWGARTGVNDGHITYRWRQFKPDRVVRQAVVFPHQTVVFPYQGHIRVSEIEQASDTRGEGTKGFVIAIRGVIWYDYPGSSQVHSTIFHAHVVRRGEHETPANWETLPTEDGAFVLASDLAVALQIGETDAT